MRFFSSFFVLEQDFIEGGVTLHGCTMYEVVRGEVVASGAHNCMLDVLSRPSIGRSALK